MPFVFFLLFLWAFASLEAVYRPYDIYTPGARAAGAGATGTSNTDHLGNASQNPAWLAEISSSRLALGLDLQTRLVAIPSRISLVPQYLPVFAWASPLGDNLSLAFLGSSSFQRRFPDENFSLFNLEVAAALSLSRHLSLGLSAGPALAVQADLYSGWGLGGSASLFWHQPGFRAGLFFRPGSQIWYDVFPGGKSVRERLPDLVKGGLSVELGKVTATFELEYIHWEISSLVEGNLEQRPALQPGFFGRLHPHIGLSFFLPFWPGLNWRTGFFTQDFYDYAGHNDRQILWTLGLGGLAGEDFWGEKLRIDISLVSSFVPSLFWKENNQIEKLQLTFEFIY